MTSKQRVALAISHHAPDRVPVDFGAHPQVVEALVSHLGLKDAGGLFTEFGVDLRGVGPTIRRQASPICYADPTREVTEDGLYIDLWGVGFRETSTPTGTYVDLAHCPLAGEVTDEDIARHEMMEPDDWDYSAVRAAASAQSDYAVWAHSRGTFEISWFIRGLDGFMTDLALEPHRACGLMDRVQERLLERLKRALDVAGDLIDMVEYNDDVGGQHGLMMSPGMWRRYLKPRIAEAFALIRRYGKHVRYHSCGGIHDIIPDLIDIGLEILNPVQALATGMDPVGLKGDFGRHLTLHGGIDMQEFLPRATPDQVREGVRRLVGILGEDGGWIACASHNLQPDIPAENIVAMYETLLEA